MRVIVGVGARAGADVHEIDDAVRASVDSSWTVVALATVTRRLDAVAAVASGMGVEVVSFSAERLASVEVPNPSVRVSAATGSSSVAEAAALLASGSERLVRGKSVFGSVTTAVSEVHSGPPVAPTGLSQETSQMPDFPPTFAEDVIARPLRTQFEVFLDEHRRAMHDSVNGLSEEQVRRSLVPSRTTLLGLLKHATFIERVWFDEAVSGRTRAEIGIPATPDESFALTDADTIAVVQRSYRQACEESRKAVAELGVDDLLLGNRRGPLPLGWVYLHMLRELAQHCGHADILREQLLAAQDPGS